MPHVRIDRRFAIALGASLAIHLALSPFVRRLPQAIAEEPPPAIVSIATAEPRRRPPPTPRPTATPKPRVVTPQRIVRATPARVVPRRIAEPLPHDAVRAPRAVAVASGAPIERGAAGDGPPGDSGSGGGAAGVGGAGDPATPLATPTAVPESVETPKPSCSTPQTIARVTNAVEPEPPESAREMGATGTTSVRVELSESGAVRDVAIYASSGNAALDRAALDAARRSSYVAGTVACRPVSGSYLFRAEFDG